MPIELTPERRSEMERVNHHINATVTYTTDDENYGKPEYWAEADKTGDCEDYALAKRRDLRALGWPQDALDIAVCRVETGGMHAVLIARTSAGDYVLDNRREALWLWNECGYRFIQITVGGSLLHWQTIPNV